MTATREMCAHCFDCVLADLRGTRIEAPEFATTAAKHPLFVTWKKEAKDGFLDLRGCIGCFDPLPMSEIATYARKSAFRDRRFQPVQLDEVPLLHCGISLLTDFENASHAYDWEIGKHGIIINFSVGGRKLSATFLPEVAKEQGWDHRTTLEHLIKKAGHRGRIGRDLVDSIDCTRYKSSKAWLSYPEYAALRSSAGAGSAAPSSSEEKVAR